MKKYHVKDWSFKKGQKKLLKLKKMSGKLVGNKKMVLKFVKFEKMGWSIRNEKMSEKTVKFEKIGNKSFESWKCRKKKSSSQYWEKFLN